MRSLKVGILGLVVAAGMAGCATTEPSYEPTGAMPVTRPTANRPAGVEGTVARVDQPEQVVVLDNGQMYRVAGNQTVLVNGQPTLISTLQPGTRVTVAGTPVVYQNGQYVTVPPGTVVAAVPATASPLRMFGRVTDIEGNGNVKVRLTDGNAFEFRPPAGTVVRKGDPVVIDFTFGAAPSASPR
jgi:hypothetical protein